MSAEPSSLAAAASRRPDAQGVSVRRVFTDGEHHPFDLVRWELRTARITGSDGAVVFEQTDVEVPEFWSQTATNIVAQKYFHGRLGTPEREGSIRQLISRVVGTIVEWGRTGGYFADADSEHAFEHELCHLLVHQMVSFNSPVWFNVGIEARPQCSACFINSVRDSMDSILDLAKTEGMLFKYGSGTGSNLSVLRSSRESLAGGGTASGPVSFMRGFDSFAGVIKSGGKTRRAAKMVILNIDHPDVAQFIRCKAEEEKKAHVLISAGYPASFDQEGGAYDSIQYQNANHSVRVTDEFMRALEDDGWWETRAVTTGDVMGRYRARALMRMIAEAAWVCGDPGLQYDTTVNRWHTCKNSGRINASNPCSEYMFLDDSACNLASLNLIRFVDEKGNFLTEALRHAVDVMILAQEIFVDFSHYPTPTIAANSHDYRPLGLGYANLGALLMAEGIPYDSPEGRAYAAAITSLMCGEAYLQSARVAEALGPFPGYPVNREPMLEVIAMHRDAAHRVPTRGVPLELRRAATDSWDTALDHGRQFGYRNSQVTVLAPTGTIGFMMDCDTTGIEPDLALVKVKRLVGGGTLKIVNQTVPRALAKLGYDEESRTVILKYLESTGTIEGAPGLKDEHLPVFDCAFKAISGTRFISPLGHLRMMGAVQPFLSGAISKTVNIPEDTIPEEIEKLYFEAWKLGLKAVAIYRDNCKGSQPLAAAGVPAGQAAFQPVRRKLPDERVAMTHKFSVEGQEGYVTVGLYEDGKPGELFITMAKEGSTLSGVMDAFATAISLTLQYGVPLEFLVNKFSHVRFEPAGWTNNPQIPYAKSIIDYIFRWLAAKFLAPEEQAAVGVQPLPSDEGRTPAQPTPQQPLLPGLELSEGAQLFINQADAPPCPTCGMMMVRSGSCYKCGNCGTVQGCS
jgi:ribonucleoside-diphosphate reductase alpha chain